MVWVIIVVDLKMQVNILDEIIPDVKVLNPLRVEVIVNDLGLTIPLPRSMFNQRFFCPKNADWIRNREEIQIDKIFTFYKELNFLSLLILYTY